MKIMCPPHYYNNGFVETQALGYMMYGYMVFFMITCISYADLTTMRFEHSTRRESLMTNNITLFAWLAEHS